MRLMGITSLFQSEGTVRGINQGSYVFEKQATEVVGDALDRSLRKINYHSSATPWRLTSPTTNPVVVFYICLPNAVSEKYHERP